MVFLPCERNVQTVTRPLVVSPLKTFVMLTEVVPGDLVRRRVGVRNERSHQRSVACPLALQPRSCYVPTSHLMRAPPNRCFGFSASPRSTSSPSERTSALGRAALRLGFNAARCRNDGRRRPSLLLAVRAPLWRHAGAAGRESLSTVSPRGGSSWDSVRSGAYRARPLPPIRRARSAAWPRRNGGRGSNSQRARTRLRHVRG